MILAPGINIKRTPACGRNFEYISEDPRLTSELAVPIVRGIETSDVAACVKHFAMNNQETERLWVNVEADERTMREIYFPAFQAVVDVYKRQVTRCNVLFFLRPDLRRRNFLPAVPHRREHAGFLRRRNAGTTAAGTARKIRESVKGKKPSVRRLERSYPAEILSAFPCHSGADRHLTVPVQNCL